MKSTSRTHKASLQCMATRTAGLPVFAVSLATLGFVLFANTNIQAAGDIVWVTAGNSIAKYYADGTAINTNFITEPVPDQGTLAGVSQKPMGDRSVRAFSSRRSAKLFGRALFSVPGTHPVS